MNNYCVYIHVNKFNHKIYIGQTSQDPENRWLNGEGYKKNAYFYRSIKKCGWDNFIHKVIKTGLTKQEANKLEAELIAKFNTTNPKKGYNVQIGGTKGYWVWKSSKQIKNKE